MNKNKDKMIDIAETLDVDGPEDDRILAEQTRKRIDAAKTAKKTKGKNVQDK
jgi:hypothetical protein